MARTDNLWINRAGNYIETSNPDGYHLLINGDNRYLNFRLVSGSLGYGLRDNDGKIQFKHSGGTWADLGTGGAGSVSIGDSIGSATAGSIFFAGPLGVLAQDNANLSWDNTNKRLNIGTGGEYISALSTYGLQTNGWFSATNLQASNHFGEYFSIADNANATKIRLVGTDASGYAYIQVNGSERARVDSSGNLTLLTGDLGVTGTRVKKGWFTDLESTNEPTVNGVQTKLLLSGGTMTGKVVSSGSSEVGKTYTPSTGSQTVALDCALNNMHIVTGHANGTAITFTVANATNSQPFIVSILQGGTTVSTIAGWFATVRWAGGTAPTLTATLNKRDTFGFIRTGASTYDGFVIGQNC